MFCTNCGNQLKPGARFCGKCGTKMYEDAEGFATEPFGDPIPQAQTNETQDTDTTQSREYDSFGAWDEQPPVTAPPETLTWSRTSRNWMLGLLLGAFVFSTLGRCMSGNYFTFPLGNILIYALIPYGILFVFTLQIEKVKPLLLALPLFYVLVAEVGQYIIDSVRFHYNYFAIASIVLSLLLELLMAALICLALRQNQLVLKIMAMVICGICKLSSLGTQISLICRAAIDGVGALYIAGRSCFILLAILTVAYWSFCLFGRKSISKPHPAGVPTAATRMDGAGTWSNGTAAPATTASGTPVDAPSTGYAVLGFFIPIVGLILYLVWRDSQPQRAHSCGKGALFGIITYVVLIIAMYAIAFAIEFSVLSSLLH